MCFTVPTEFRLFFYGFPAVPQELCIYLDALIPTLHRSHSNFVPYSWVFTCYVVPLSCVLVGGDAFDVSRFYVRLFLVL